MIKSGAGRNCGSCILRFMPKIIPGLLLQLLIRAFMRLKIIHIACRHMGFRVMPKDYPRSLLLMLLNSGIYA